MLLIAERIKKFRRIIASMKKSCSIIISQFDPDAAACAMALAWIINLLRGRNGFKVKIFYAGSISHAQNRLIFNRFNLEKYMKPMSMFTPDDNYNVILVDSSSGTDGRLLPNIKILPVVVIDHHRGGDQHETGKSFVWIDDVGACATLLVELIQSLKLKFSEEDQTVPLLLAVGIHSDTEALAGCHNRDRDAYAFAAAGANTTDLQQTFRYPLPVSHYENMARALANKVIHDGRLVTHLGRIKADQGDDISTAADFFIRMNGVTLAVVWAIIEGTKTIRLSARCSDTTLPLDAFLRERFPSGSSGAKLSPDGRGIGGGTVSVDFGPGLMEETMDKAIAFISEWIKVVTFKK